MKYEIKYTVEKKTGSIIAEFNVTSIDTLDYKENTNLINGIKRKILNLPSTSWLATMEDVKILGIANSL